MRTTILFLALVAFLTGCSERRFRQNGPSAMSPTIEPNELVVADMSAFRNNAPQRWDVVVFQHSSNQSFAKPGEIWVMRIVGLPGESLEIRDDGIYIDERREAQPERISNVRYFASPPGGAPSAIRFPYKLAADAYFLLGDNTTNALDSRYWGSVSRQNVLGKVKGK